MVRGCDWPQLCGWEELSAQNKLAQTAEKSLLWGFHPCPRTLQGGKVILLSLGEDCSPFLCLQTAPVPCAVGLCQAAQAVSR